jgi:hypothetical protein
VKFSEIAARLNGISTPIFGLSWEASRSDVAASREVITFLEDKRALYNPYEVEVPEHVVESVIDIRRQMTQSLGTGGLADQLTSSLRAIRAACRKFMDQVGARDEGGSLYIPPTAFGVAHMHDIEFNQSLGELRGVVGTEVAKIAAAHGLDVEDGLASIFPAADTE